MCTFTGPASPPTELYPYTQQLEKLAAKKLAPGPPLPCHATDIVSPVNISFWQDHLRHHPDQQFAQLILSGLREGFPIGFEATSHLKSATSNLISAREHTEVVSAYIQEEVLRGHIGHVGPRDTAKQLNIQLSPLGAIPKKNKPDKWRLIMDLSSPRGSSVNDGISKEDCSFHYTSVDLAVQQIRQLGPGTLMGKMDIEQAYRNIPVAPCDRRLLGLEWQSQTYVEKVLPFGLRSAPIIFSAVADALLWIMTRRGVSWAIHYVDDFLTIGRPNSDECQHNMDLMHEVCQQAGLPLEPSKTQGPSDKLTFLGIELDTAAMEMRLPEDKLALALKSLAQWRLLKRACRKRDLLSLIGVLSHASKVVRNSRIFLRRLIDLSTTVEEPDHFIRLNNEAKSDIEWWFQFIRQWNGRAMLPPPVMQTHTLVSDASGSWGCGAFWGHHWFYLPWNNAFQDTHISAKELAPIVLATAIWGKAWHGYTIQVLSDNTAAVAAINNGTSTLEESAHLLRCLAFLTAHHQCEIVARHIPGQHNVLADALSRNNIELFRMLHPQAQPWPAVLPEQLIRLLIIEQPDWTSQRWTELWTATLTLV